jgi:predicted dehydrogenase
MAERSADGRLIGLSGSLMSDRAWMQFEVGIRSPTHQRLIELRCRDGIARLSDAYDASISLLRTTGLTEPASPPELRTIEAALPLLKELEAFVSYVAGRGPAPRSSAADALAVVERIAALRRLAGLP